MNYKYTCKLCKYCFPFSTNDIAKMKQHLFSEHREMSFGHCRTVAHVPDFNESVKVNE